MRLIFLPNESTLNPFNCEKFLRILGSYFRCTISSHFYIERISYRLNCDLNSCQTTNLKDFWSPTFVSSNDVYLTTANSAFRNDYFVPRKAFESINLVSLFLFLSLSNLKNFVSFSFFQITIVFYKKDASYLVFEQR